jgi:hypothetical protein
MILFLVILFVWVALCLVIVYRQGYKKGFVLGRMEAIQKTNESIYDL